MENIIFSKETIENLFECKVDNFHYETTFDGNGNIVRYDIFIQPKQEVKHIHVDF